ncbi:MAG: hypothetical protein SFW35_05915 [Chitinophagales bacterium]|nr:hypothetical protein [Chitinophagales bacterium]
MNQQLLIDITGWLGAACVLYAYLMVSARRLEGDSLHYQTFNILGALFLIINTYFHHAYPSTIVNIIWVGVAVYSLLNRKKANQ